MTPATFTQWLADMKLAGLARSDADCGRQLGITSRQVLNMKRKGATLQTALACAALLDGLPPYRIDNPPPMN